MLSLAIALVAIYTDLHHAAGSDNAIQSVTVDPPGASPTTQDFVYDIAGNLVFDGAWFYQYDGLNRLVQVNAADTLTAGDFNAAGAPDDPNTFEPGDLMGRYAYDGLGRLIVRQVPISRGVLYSWNPLVQTEHYYYDGVRRIQSVITREPNDLVLVAAATFNDDFLDVPPTEVLEYVWGPDYVDELVCQYNDPNGDPFWALTDANYNVMAVVDSDCDVAEQYVYDPYGGLLAVETLDPNLLLANRVAHQGLFFEAFADDVLSPPLPVGGPGIYDTRNRRYEPYLSRFLQRDVHKAGGPYLGRKVFFGAHIAVETVTVKPKEHYGDSLSLYASFGLNPLAATDPLGLFSYGDILSTAGNVANLYQKYEYAQTAFGYFRKILSGASLSNVMLGIAIEIAADKVGGKALDSLVDFAGSVKNTFARRFGPQRVKIETAMAKGDYREAHKLMYGYDSMPHGVPVHHLLPKNERQMQFFMRQGLNPHDPMFTQLLDSGFHTWLHSSRKGFDWNGSWDDFIMNNPNAKADDIVEYMRELFEEARNAYQRSQ